MVAYSMLLFEKSRYGLNVSSFVLKSPCLLLLLFPRFQMQINPVM